MTNPMDFINEILDGGYTAPMLADKANSKDQTYAEEGERLLNHIKQFETIELKSEPDSSSPSYRNLYIADAAVRAYKSPFEVRLPVKVGAYQIQIRANADGVPQFLQYLRNAGDICLFPEEVIVDVVKGRTFTTPFTVVGEPTWNGKLTNRLNAADIRNSMLSAVKAALQTTTGVCDTFTMKISLLPDRKQRSKESGKLTKGNYQDFARLFFSVGADYYKTKAILENQIPHDFGFKNVDDLACAIIAASTVYNVELLPDGRYPLADFASHYQLRLREARSAGSLTDSEVETKADLKAFITFLGGKLR
jgi:hypothetical protein